MQIWKDLGGNLVEKEAELAGTYDMPWSPSDKNKNAKPADKSSIQKTAEAEEDAALRAAFGADTKPDDNEDEPVTGENIDKQPQPRVLKPTVDVTSQEPPKLVTTKQASRYALPSQGRYPLDSYGEVKTASAYFDEWHVRMSPEMKREFCQNMVKRAHELSIPVSELAERYGAEGYAPPSQIKIAMDARRSVLKDEEDIELLDKVASAQSIMLPDAFAEVLGEFDRSKGLDEFYGGDVPDPYFSTFAKKAAEDPVKEESDTSPEDAIIMGNEYLPMRKLITFSKMGKDVMIDRFGEEVADAFAKDPKGIFDSLPRDQKLVVLRLASAVDAQFQSATKS